MFRVIFVVIIVIAATFPVVSADCGRIFTPANVNTNFNGVKGKFSTAPWNAGVYRNDGSNNFVMICGGTLISPNLVVSAAQFFWKKGLSNNIIRDTNNFKIAFGKYERDYSVMDNSFTQIIDMELIYVEENFVGESGYYTNDIAIIVLKKNVMLSDVVMPICIDWTRKLYIPNGSIGKIVGWGMTDDLKPSPVLLELSLPYTDRTTCHNLNKSNTVLPKYVTGDKFCGIKGPGFQGGEAGFGGAGLTFAQDDMHYIVGVMSLAYRGTIEILTDVSKHIPWLLNIYSQYNHIELNANESNNKKGEKIQNTKIGNLESTTSTPLRPTTTSTTVQNTQIECKIPFSKGSIYTLIDNQNTVLSSGMSVIPKKQVEVTCDEGYHKEFKKKWLLYCTSDGEFYPPITENDPICMKKCQPIKSDSLDLTCTYNGLEVNCADLAIPGTTLKPKCKQAYSLPNNQAEYPVQLVCSDNGVWSKKELLYTCYPICGQKSASVSPLIVNGSITTSNASPWNVGIYRKTKEVQVYEMICGGTIIHSNLVVSAAHCFWDDKSGKKIDLSQDIAYKIGVSKYTRDISIKDNKFTQILDVKIIHIPPRYDGKYGLQENDIAVVVLSTNIQMSFDVWPACMDWNSRMSIIDGINGTVAGWGLTEKKIYSSTLLSTSLPYISHDTCLNISKDKFKIYVTKDKFCAGYQSSGSAVDQGDSGAGLIIQHANIHFLTGVVSLKENVEEITYATFTAVSSHIRWIETFYVYN